MTSIPLNSSTHASLKIKENWVSIPKSLNQSQINQAFRVYAEIHIFDWIEKRYEAEALDLIAKEISKSTTHLLDFEKKNHAYFSVLTKEEAQKMKVQLCMNSVFGLDGMKNKQFNENDTHTHLMKQKITIHNFLRGFFSCSIKDQKIEVSIYQHLFGKDSINAIFQRIHSEERKG